VVFGIESIPKQSKQTMMILFSIFLFQFSLEDVENFLLRNRVRIALGCGGCRGGTDSSKATLKRSISNTVKT
jgi:hypothetical protein